jgi:SNF family Na+-dependent transporter
MSFWDVIWFIIVSFAFVAYLMVMLNIVTDLFRDRETSGGLKAAWIVGLIFLPLLTAVLYLVTRGAAMAERQVGAVRAVQDAQDTYIRSVAGTSAADQIEKAKALLDSGALSAEEFESLKATALAG